MWLLNLKKAYLALIAGLSLTLLVIKELGLRTAILLFLTYFSLATSMQLILFIVWPLYCSFLNKQYLTFSAWIILTPQVYCFSLIVSHGILCICPMVLADIAAVFPELPRLASDPSSPPALVEIFASVDQIPAQTLGLDRENSYEESYRENRCVFLGLLIVWFGFAIWLDHA